MRDGRAPWDRSYTRDPQDRDRTPYGRDSRDRTGDSRPPLRGLSPRRERSYPVPLPQDRERSPPPRTSERSPVPLRPREEPKMQPHPDRLGSLQSSSGAVLDSNKSPHARQRNESGSAARAARDARALLSRVGGAETRQESNGARPMAAGRDDRRGLGGNEVNFDSSKMGNQKGQGDRGRDPRVLDGRAPVNPKKLNGLPSHLDFKSRDVVNNSTDRTEFRQYSLFGGDRDRQPSNQSRPNDRRGGRSDRDRHGFIGDKNSGRYQRGSF